MSMLDAVFERQGDTAVIENDQWRGPLVTTLRWSNLAADLLQEMHTVLPPKAAIDVPAAKAARTHAAAESKASAPRQSSPTPSIRLLDVRDTPMTPSEPRVSTEKDVSDTNTSAVQREPGTGEEMPIDSPPGVKIEKSESSSEKPLPDAVAPQMASTSLTTERQPADVAMAPSDTRSAHVHPPIVSVSGSTPAVSTASQPSAFPAPSGLLASTSILEQRESVYRDEVFGHLTALSWWCCIDAFGQTPAYGSGW